MPEYVIKHPEVTIAPLSFQTVRLEPVVATVYGGGTSAVLMRGESAANGGVRVTDDTRQTSPLNGIDPSGSTASY